MPVEHLPPLRVVMADGPDGPLPDPRTVASAVGAGDRPLEVVLGWIVRRPGWLQRLPGVTVTCLLVGPGTRAAVAEGVVRPVATRLSAVPGLLAGRLRPDVAVVGGYEDPAHRGAWLLARSPGWAGSAARSARQVVVERWPGAPPSGCLPLPVQPAAVVDRDAPADPPPVNRRDAELRALGMLVAELVPERATVQWGPGAVGAAVIEALDRPVAVRSGLVTAELATLAGRGLLHGVAEAAYIWGGTETWQLMEEGRLRLVELTRSHDLKSLSETERFVAINTALQVGLDGSANVEVAGGRIVAGPGGHPDFAAAASRSPGGLSIVALPAVAAGRSTIVARPEVVSSPRFDVDLVVTEHGLADLRGLDPEARADALVAVAAPTERERLRSGF